MKDFQFTMTNSGVNDLFHLYAQFEIRISQFKAGGPQ